MFCYEDFLEKLNKVYGNVPFKTVVSYIVCDKNFLGEGHSKKCYTIPGVNDYVLAILKNQYNPDSIWNLEPCDVKFSECNFSQKIAFNKAGVIIKAYVAGVSHSVPNYFGKFYDYETYNRINYSDAQLVLSQIKNIAKYPLESYMYFANELNILNKYDIRVDACNPNNLLIDDKKHTFSIIDFEDINVHHDYSFLPRPVNSSQDMICLLLDSLLHIAYYNVLKASEKKELVAASNIVINKCSRAADATGLNTNSECTKEFFNDMWQRYKIHGSKVLRHYLDFAKFYKLR